MDRTAHRPADVQMEGDVAQWQEDALVQLDGPESYVKQVTYYPCQYMLSIMFMTYKIYRLSTSPFINYTDVWNGKLTSNSLVVSVITIGWITFWQGSGQSVLKPLNNTLIVSYCKVVQELVIFKHNLAPEGKWGFANHIRWGVETPCPIVYSLLNEVLVFSVWSLF